MKREIGLSIVSLLVGIVLILISCPKIASAEEAEIVCQSDIICATSESGQEYADLIPFENEDPDCCELPVKYDGGCEEGLPIPDPIR